MCCAVVQLNVTGTLSPSEQQSAAIYVHCVTAWVSWGKTATNLRLLFLAYLSVRPSAFENARSAERFFNKFFDSI